MVSSIERSLTNRRNFLKVSELDFLVMSLLLGDEFMLYLRREGSKGRAVYVQRGQVLVEFLRRGKQQQYWEDRVCCKRRECDAIADESEVILTQENRECDARETECDVRETECDVRETECDARVTECDVRETECDVRVGECNARLENLVSY